MRMDVIAVAALCIATPSAAQELARAPVVAAAIATLDRGISAEMGVQSIPALQIAVVHDDSVVWSKAYGLADVAGGVKADEHTKFVIGSISKLFTALAIVQLRDAGKLDLDDRVTRHLPWFRLADAPQPTITLRELLLQFAGLPREPGGGSWADRVMPSRDALIHDLPLEPQAIPPETEWKYSNLGYAILGLVIEAASNQSYADYVTEHVLQPLGMTDTVVAPLPGMAHLALGYGARLNGVREARPFLAMGGVTPAAGIASTAPDLARLLEWMLADTDGPVLSAQSRREMLRVQAMTEDWSVGQGLGFELRRVGGDVRIGHAGRAAGFAARLDVDPAAHLGVVVLTSADDGSPTKLVDQAMTALQPAIAQATAHTPPQPNPAWQKYVGTYTFEQRDSAIGIVDGRLVWFDPEAADPAKTRIFLDPAGPGRFRFDSGALVGEIVTFETGPDGRVTAMRAAGTTDRKK